MTQQFVERKGGKYSLSSSLYSWYIEEDRNTHLHYHSTVSRQGLIKTITLIIPLKLVETLNLGITLQLVERERQHKITLFITLQLVERGGQKHPLSLSYQIY